MELDITEVMGLGLEGSYNLYLAIRDQDQQKEYARIRFGELIEFDIYNVIADNYRLKPKQQIISIEGRTHTLRDFYTELENRRTLINKAIIDSMKQEKLTKSRLSDATDQ